MKNTVILSDNIIAKRRNEIFDRISASCLLTLIAENQPDQESVYNVNTDSPALSVVVPSDSRPGPPLRNSGTPKIFDFRSSIVEPGLADANPYSVARLVRDDVSIDLWRAKDARVFVYADNDKATVAATTRLVQKGWPNAVAVSGGFDEIKKLTPSTAGSSKPSAR